MATTAVVPVGAIILPPQPLTLSATWNCSTPSQNNALCQLRQRNTYQPGVTHRSHQQYPERAYYPPKQQQPRFVDQPPARDSRLYNAYYAPATQPGESLITPSGVSRTTTNSLERLLNATHGSFVLQWLVARTPEPLKDLKKRFPILHQATIVSYQRKGKRWYVLLDGPFQSIDAANEALVDPSRYELARKLYPWTRSVASIQKLDLIRPDAIQPPTKPNPSGKAGNNLFASISPAYPNINKDRSNANNIRPTRPNTVTEDDVYHRQASLAINERNQYDSSGPGSRYRNSTLPSSKRFSYQSSDFIRMLQTRPDGFTIQWLESPRPETLKRAKTRFPQLQHAHIISYRRNNQNWYALVSAPYLNKYLAKNTLNNPALTRAVTRLNPQIRPVKELQLKLSPRKRIKQSYRQTESASLMASKTEKTPLYTVQWFAANNKEAVEQMKKRFPELKHTRMLHYRKNNKDWFVLLQGEYGSGRLALSAINSPELSKAVKALHPWTRPVNPLKKHEIQPS